MKNLQLRIAAVKVAAAALAMISMPASATIVDEVEPNDFLTAQNLDPNFSLDFDPNITNSTTMPHSSVRAPFSLQQSYDVYSFTVAAAGIQGVFDIDQADTYNWLTLLDSAFLELAGNWDGGVLDAGSISSIDPYFTYTFTSPGTYFLMVGSPVLDPTGDTNEYLNLPTYGPYVLNASLGTAPVPEPATWAMMLLGFGAVGVVLRRRRSDRPANALA